MFWYDFVLLGGALLVASIHDLRTREVPDWLSYALIAAGVASHALVALTSRDLWYFVEGLAGLAVCLGLAYAMFYAGQWGGGDSKLLIGIGAFLGFRVYPEFEFPVLAAFMINALLVGAVYGLVWTFTIAAIYRKKFMAQLRTLMIQPMYRHGRISIRILAPLALLLTIFVPELYRPIPVLLAAIAIAIFYIWLTVRAVEGGIMEKQYPIGKLTEGDWIVNDVIVDGKRICGPKDLGISLEQIATLKALEKQQKISKVLVKEGIPFVPTFFIALLIAQLFGSWFLAWLVY